MQAGEDRMVTQLRVLYLRTFGGSKADHIITASISQAIGARGSVIVMGNKEGQAEISRFWAASPNSHAALNQCVEYIVSSNAEWKIKIHRQIVDADVIVMFFSPKGESFPPVSHGNPGDISQSDYIDFLNQVYATPMSGHMSGIGLLNELSYVQRLGAMPKVVTICRAVEFQEIRELIQLAEFAAHGFAHSADLRKTIAPRMTVHDQQLRWLAGTRGPILFSDPSPGDYMIDSLREQLGPAFEDVLAGRTKSLYEEHWGRLEYAYPAGTPDSDLPIGRSNIPRSLPPDGKRKIFRYWNVEDLGIIPIGEVIDISLQAARELLSKDAIERGCPYCHAPIQALCFHAYGLSWPSNEAVRAKCQTCGRRSSLWGDMLMDM